MSSRHPTHILPTPLRPKVICIQRDLSSRESTELDLVGTYGTNYVVSDLMSVRCPLSGEHSLCASVRRKTENRHPGRVHACDAADHFLRIKDSFATKVGVDGTRRSPS